VELLVSILIVAAMIGIPLLLKINAANAQRERNSLGPREQIHEAMWKGGTRDQRKYMLRAGGITDENWSFEDLLYFPWGQIPAPLREEIIKGAPAFPRESSSPATKPLDAIANKVAEFVADEFSPGNWIKFFGENAFADGQIIESTVFAEGHTIDSSVAIWCALGYICVITSVGAAKGIDANEGLEIVDSTLRKMLSIWGMPPQVFQKFDEFNKRKLAKVLDAYASVCTPQDLNRFFSLYLAEIRTGDISFSPKIISENPDPSRMRQPEFDLDPEFQSAVVRMVTTIQKYIVEYFDQSLGEAIALHRNNQRLSRN
jgi:hypothetical protein